MVYPSTPELGEATIKGLVIRLPLIGFTRKQREAARAVAASVLRRRATVTLVEPKSGSNEDPHMECVVDAPSGSRSDSDSIVKTTKAALCRAVRQSVGTTDSSQSTPDTDRQAQASNQGSRGRQGRNHGRRQPGRRLSR